MPSAENDEIRHRILEILHKAAQENPEAVGVDRKRMLELLQTTKEKMDFNMLYLEEKDLVELHKVYGSLWEVANITAFGTDVVENKTKYGGQFPFVQTTIQEIHGNVYGPAVQAVQSNVNINQQISDVFKKAQDMVDSRTGLSEALKNEIRENLKLLEGELKNRKPDAGKIQRTWEWLKNNANWIVPTLTQVVLEGTKIALGL